MRTFIFIAVLLVAFTKASAVNQELAAEIAHRLSMLKAEAANYGFRVKYESDVLNDCEVAYFTPVRGTPTAVFSPIVAIMSNNWHEVMLHVSEYATNAIDRILLENTGSFLGEDAYLGYLSLLADKVVSNEISLVEFEKFQVNAWHNHPVSSVVYRRYQDPVVSNLVIKFQQAGVNTNRCQWILSGQAAEHYQKLLDDGHLD